MPLPNQLKWITTPSSWIPPKVWRYIPHERIVYETEEEIQAGYFLQKATKDEKDQLKYEVKELRDESNRPWYKFFDEYEYRYTTEETDKHNWWRWYDKDTPTDEKKLLVKLDVLITLVFFVSYWSKSLDQNNLNNAYVSGMKEDLGMKGNDLINTQVVFLVAGVIFEAPMAYILPRFPPAYTLFICELGWSFFTLLTFTSHNAASLKAFRFFVAAFEAAFFPTVHHVYANWLKNVETSRRTGFFYFGLYLGNLTSGLLQSAIHNQLDGVNGLEGWRWMFIIDSLISFAICFLTFFSIPGTPFKCYSIWLSDDEIKLARRRMRRLKIDEKVPSSKSFISWKPWKTMLTSWHFWILTIGNVGGFASNAASNGSFALWLKSLNKYSIGKLNNLTAIPPALGIVYVFITCFGADVTRKRFLMIMFAQSMNIIGTSILAHWDVSDNAKWFAFCFGYWSWSQSSVFYPLQNDILRRDANTRAIEFVTSQVFAAQAYAWISKLLYPTVEAPKFHKGFIGASCFSALHIVFMGIAFVFYKKDERKFAFENGIVIYNSAKGETPEAAVQEYQNIVRTNVHDDDETIDDDIPLSDVQENTSGDDDDVAKSSIIHRVKS